jgi:hypothetical protein
VVNRRVRNVGRWVVFERIYFPLKSIRLKNLALFVGITGTGENYR